MDIKEIQTRDGSQDHRVKVSNPHDVNEGDRLSIGAIEERYHKYPEGHPFRDEEGQTRMTTGFVDEGGIPIVVEGTGDSWEQDGEECCYIYFTFDVDAIDPAELEKSGVFGEMTRQDAVRLGDALRNEL